MDFKKRPAEAEDIWVHMASECAHIKSNTKDSGIENAALHCCLKSLFGNFKLKRATVASSAQSAF